MKSNRIFALICAVGLVAGCGGGGGGSSSGSGPPGNGGGGGAGSAANALPISVAGTGTALYYPNKPTVSVTVCTPGTTNCQTIGNILLDTGSFGLRIFKQALGVPLSPIATVSGVLAECIPFTDGSGDWGPVEMADVVLGGEPAVTVPVHVIDATFGGVPSACKPPNVTSLDQDPASVGFNGILGVGLFTQDCGPGCAALAANGAYFSCTGAACTGAAVPLANQVQNPVALLPVDNNGVIVQMPAVPAGGTATVSGQLFLGIGTQSNNDPGGVTKFPANAFGEFTTVFNGANLTNSFIDSGSNGLFLPATASLPLCPSPDDSWFCPPAIQNLVAVTVGATGAPRGDVDFQIGNALSLFRTGDNALAELGGPAVVAGGVDWGMPFFYGRRVVVGIEGRNSSLGSGPYWAY